MKYSLIEWNELERRNLFKANLKKLHLISCKLDVSSKMINILIPAYNELLFGIWFN